MDNRTFRSVASAELDGVSQSALEGASFGWRNAEEYLTRALGVGSESLAGFPVPRGSISEAGALLGSSGRQYDAAGVPQPDVARQAGKDDVLARHSLILGRWSSVLEPAFPPATNPGRQGAAGHGRGVSLSDSSLEMNDIELLQRLIQQQEWMERPLGSAPDVARPSTWGLDSDGSVMAASMMPGDGMPLPGPLGGDVASGQLAQAQIDAAQSEMEAMLRAHGLLGVSIGQSAGRTRKQPFALPSPEQSAGPSSSLEEQLSAVSGRHLTASPVTPSSRPGGAGEEAAGKGQGEGGRSQLSTQLAATIQNIRKKAADEKLPSLSPAGTSGLAPSGVGLLPASSFGKVQARGLNTAEGMLSEVILSGVDPSLLPTPQLRRKLNPGDHLGIFADTGAHRKMARGLLPEARPPPLGPTAPPPQPESRILFLKQRLMFIARALDSGNMGHFEHLFTQLKPIAKPRGDAIERLLHHFLLALEMRRNNQGFTFFCTPVKRRLKDLAAFQKWYFQHLPFSRFASTLFNSSLLDFTRGHRQVHIVNVGPMLNGFLPGIMQALAGQSWGVPTIHITNIDTTNFVSPGRRDLKNLKTTTDVATKLQNEAAALGVPRFEFQQVDLDENGLHLLYCVKRQEGEAVVVCSAYEMMHFPNEVYDTASSTRDYMLQWIRDLSPVALCILESDLDSTSTDFLRRFTSCLEHHYAAFDLNDAVTGPKEKRTVQIFEELIYGRSIANIISCEAKERVVRPESMGQWMSRLQQAGLIMGRINPATVRVLQDMVAGLPKGFGLNLGLGCVQLTWRNVPRIFYGVLRPLIL